MVQDNSSQVEIYNSKSSHAKAQHESFRLSEPFFRQIIESLEEYAVFTTDTDGNISSWNPGAERIFGYTEQEIIGQHAAILFIPEDRQKQAPEKELQEALRQGQEKDEKWHQRKDGSRFWASGLVFPLKDEQGTLQGFTKIARDLTDKKRHDEERQALLREVETEKKKLESVFERAPAFMAILRGNNHVFEMVNAAYYQLIGHRDIIGKPVLEALPEVQGQGYIELLDNVLATGKPFIGTEMKVGLQRIPGGIVEERYVNFVYEPLKDATGANDGIVAHGYDVTDQVVARQKIQESEVRFRTMAEGAEILIAVSDETSNATYFNQAWTELTGRPMSELLNFGWADLIHPEERERFVTIYLHAFEKREPFSGEFRILNKDGEYRWLLAKGPVRFRSDGSFAGYISSFIDITDRKRVEEALQKSEAKLRRIIDSNMIGIIFYNVNGDITEANKYILDLIDYSEQELREGKLKWSELTPKEFAYLDTKALEDVAKYGSCMPYEKELLRKDGSRVPILIGGASFTDDEYAGVAYIIDITEQKQLERQKDDFLGIASHELKTPVTSIKAFTQVLQRRFAQAGDERASALLGKMDTQINKLTSLITDLLDVTKIEGDRLQFNEAPFFFDELVDEVVEEIQRTTRKHTVEIVGVTKRTVFGDKDRIGQVISNFLTNAIKYAPHSDTILVKRSTEHGFVTLCVQDFGIGIPEDLQQRVFERFYRVGVDRTVSGIGLGLYISAEIIKRQRGTIWVESEPGQGATFCFSLPVEQ